MNLWLKVDLSRRGGEPMRCDLHVHSRFSGRATLPVLRHLCNESYSEPEAVYAEARRRGMDLVTLTDHDTIEGALAIAGRPDTFVSEEVTCLLPGGRELHVGVYDLDETQHQAISTRRSDPESLFAYLAEQELPATLNHAFSALTGRRETLDLEVALRRLRLVESRNGMLPEATQQAAARIARSWGLSQIGGSDSHTLLAIATAHTAVLGARTKQGFLDGLRRGHTVPKGDSGTYARLTSNLASLAASALRHGLAEAGTSAAAALRALAMLAIAPLLPCLPLAAALVHLHEGRFAQELFHSFCRSLVVPPFAVPRRRARRAVIRAVPALEAR
jgi:predicted metal-dependent phosphoesterase TrpH